MVGQQQPMRSADGGGVRRYEARRPVYGVTDESQASTFQEKTHQFQPTFVFFILFFADLYLIKIGWYEKNTFS